LSFAEAKVVVDLRFAFQYGELLMITLDFFCCCKIEISWTLLLQTSVTGDCLTLNGWNWLLRILKELIAIVYNYRYYVYMTNCDKHISFPEQNQEPRSNDFKKVYLLFVYR